MALAETSGLIVVTKLVLKLAAWEAYMYVTSTLVEAGLNKIIEFTKEADT